MLFGYAFDDDPVVALDLFEEETPDFLLDAFTDPTIVKKAWNASFERTAIASHYNIISPVDQWECSMNRAARCGLPLGLGQAAAVLRLDQLKEKGGRALITYFCTPVKKPIKKNDFRERNYPQHDPVKWQRFKEYCKQDVETERAVCRATSFYNISEFEKRAWNLDQEINERGVAINIPFIRGAVKMVDFYEERLAQEVLDLAGIDNIKSVPQIKKWLFTETGEEVAALNKETIPDILKNTKSDKVKRVIEIRQEASKTSIQKYPRTMECLCKDGRIHGMHEHYGANRTGRAAGRLLQHHNYPQGDIELVETPVSLVARNEKDWLEYVYGPVPKTLSSLLRSSFIASPGHRLGISDLKGIEARINAWLAGEQWVLDVCNTHGKIYEMAASRMFSVPFESIDKGSPLRKKGKVGVLACIAKDSLVLTDIGLIPIQDVKLFHKLWDGNSWVSHKGVIFSGIKRILSYGGLTATKDHIVWVEGQRDPIRFDEAATSGAYLLQSGDGGQAIRVGRDYFPGEKMEPDMESLLCTDAMHELPKRAMDELQQHHKRKIKRVSTMFQTQTSPYVVREKISRCERALSESETSKLREVWQKRHRVSFRVSNESVSVSNGFVSCTRSKIRSRSSRQREALRRGKLKICNPKIQLRQQKDNANAFLESGRMAILLQSSSAVSQERIYTGTDIRESVSRSHRKEKELAWDQGEVETFDILDCGPHNRFTVSDVLVHNCGFGGSVAALVKGGALKEGLTEEELPEVVSGFRKSNTNIVNSWKAYQKTAEQAIKTGGPCYVHETELWNNDYHTPNKGISFRMHGRSMVLTLPSGRELVYINTAIEEGEFGPRITYYGVGQEKKNWTKLDTWGGKICENICQAVARDILYCGLQNLDNAGYKIVLHIHDESVCEIPNGTGSIEDINRLMCIAPSWADGLPLEAEGCESLYWKK